MQSDGGSLNEDIAAPGAFPTPYLLFLGDVVEPAFAKTALGLADWAGEHCIGEYALTGATVTTGLHPLSPAEAAARGARAMVIGVANAGGYIPDHWIAALEEALASGLDLVSGMHVRLRDIPRLRAAAAACSRRLIDVRDPPADLSVATGLKRSGRRLLTVGTDCALGKKYTALALARAFRRRGLDADFRATGQTGILISGRGIPLDAVISDFAAGAAERLSPDAEAEHWDVIEGQGSLMHPAYAGVSLALLHGSQPDVFVVCDLPGRSHMLGLAAYPVPAIEDVIELTIRLGSRTNPRIRCGGVSLNTAAMATDEADGAITALSARLGLPAADPVRGGDAFDRLVNSCLCSAQAD